MARTAKAAEPGTVQDGHADCRGQMSQSNAGVRLDFVPLRQLRKWPGNPKRHDQKKIEQSIVRFGFKSPLDG